MFNSFSNSGQPVRRADLSEHALYDLDAFDPYEGAETFGADDEYSQEELEQPLPDTPAVLRWRASVAAEKAARLAEEKARYPHNNDQPF